MLVNFVYNFIITRKMGWLEGQKSLDNLEPSTHAKTYDDCVVWVVMVM